MLFHRDDWTLFRNLNTLGQKAGVPRERLGALVLKELVDNALDAGAECSIRELGNGRFEIEDDGPGIDGDDEHIATLFSIRRPLLSGKLLRLPKCGALGNGLRVVTGAVLASGGELRVRTKGRWLVLEPRDDGHTSVRRDRETQLGGTLVRITLGGDLAEADDVTDMALRAISLRGASRYEGKTSAWWYDSDAFFELLQASDGSLRDVLALFNGFKPSTFDSDLLETNAYTVDRESAQVVLRQLRTLKPAPKPSALGEVGEHARGGHGYAKKYGTIKLLPSRGSGTLYAEIPAVIEAWASKLDKDDSPGFTVYVNRTPITTTTKAWAGSGSSHGAETALNGCGLNHYVRTGRAPMSIHLCVTSPYMPITTDGKEPNLLPLFSEIRDAVAAACRKARKATSDGKRSSGSLKDVILENIEEAIATASGDGRHRFSLRQLFYAVRPFVIDETGEEPNYNYFSTVVTGYEGSIGRDVPGMYRDARGSLYHPHTGETIALGTLNVEKYERPTFRFNKVLYIEKGGFLPLLIDAKWPERHDCAILTSQGFASRAARDTLDLMGDSDEEILFFCIHDSDGPGTCIYEALTEATKARPKRRVTVVNLGLDPWEAVDMELATEKVERKRGEVPVADYVLDRSPRWKTWLQTQRVELNAMTSPAFLAWLDGKMEKYDRLGKVIPPTDVLSTKFEEDARKLVRERIVERLLAEAGIDTLVDKACMDLDVPAGRAIRKDIVNRLEEVPENPWETPLGEIVKAAVDKRAAKERL